MKERLAELIKEGNKTISKEAENGTYDEKLAEYLIAHGVTVIPNDDIIAWGTEQLKELTDGTMINTVESNYHDDVLRPASVLETYNAFDPTKYTFEDYLYERIYVTWGIEAEADGEEYILECIKARSAKASFHGAFLDYCAGRSAFDVLEEFGFLGSELNITSYLNKDYCVNFMFATDSEMNYDRTAIIKYFKEEKRNEECSDNALTQLIEQQGYTLEEVIKAYDSGESSESKFVNSVVEEIKNTSYSMYELTVMTSLKGERLLDVLDAVKRGEGYIVLPENTRIGLFNRWEGSGVLEIELERPVVLPCSLICMTQIEGTKNEDYTVDDTFGFVYLEWVKSKAEVSLRSVIANEAKLLENVEDSFNIRIGNKKALFIQVIEDHEKYYSIELNDVVDGAFEPCGVCNYISPFGDIVKLVETVEEYLQNMKGK